MKVLFVAISSSIHTSRWINQLKNNGINVYLFPATYDFVVHEDLKWVKQGIPLFSFMNYAMKRIFKTEILSFYSALHKIRFKLDSNYQKKKLHQYIRKIKPDLIHSLETQSAGYLVSDVKTTYYSQAKFPLWWHTNWGSDIYLFGRIPAHVERIKQVLKDCDFYSCECDRDVDLALKNGFIGKVLPVYPNTGGFNLDLIRSIRKGSVNPSQRKYILLKGYQGWAGRALVGFRALERCADSLKGFEIYIHSNTKATDIQIASAVFTHSTKIPVTLVPIDTPHSKIMELQSKARISIGLSISDGISTSLLEAMAMGSFPIQSYTACANEWITDSETGFIVPPEDPDIIELAIRKALSDDHLVDSAAEVNYLTIAKKTDHKILQQMTIDTYRKILNLEYETNQN